MGFKLVSPEPPDLHFVGLWLTFASLFATFLRLLSLTCVHAPCSTPAMSSFISLAHDTTVSFRAGPSLRLWLPEPSLQKDFPGVDSPSTPTHTQASLHLARWCFAASGEMVPAFVGRPLLLGFVPA